MPNPKIFIPAVILMTLLIASLAVSLARAEGETDTQIVNAIYRAEGGMKTRHPYGILAKYKHTTPRQACFNTVRSARQRFAKQAAEGDFVVFLARTYCPIGAANDPGGLNRHWIKNVKYFLTIGKEA